MASSGVSGVGPITHAITHAITHTIILTDKGVLNWPSGADFS